MNNPWHPEGRLLARYAVGDADEVVASSLEAHLVACPSCRVRLARHVPAARLADNWDGVLAALDAPRRGVLERTLIRLGVGQGSARILVATPTLRWSWLASVAIAVGFGMVAAARPSSAALVLVLSAPIVPLAGVAVAFSRTLDPAADIVDATPRGGLRLLLLRTIASVVPSVAVASVGAVAAAAGAETWALWLLPALALSALSLLLASVAPIGRVATALAAAWAAAVLAGEAAARGSFRALRSGGPPESVLFDLRGQALAASVAVLGTFAVVVLAHRHVEPRRPA